ncbi:MAG: hypothetical protein KatS3mg043_1081 [Rhodothermaceae bacterium]|nr:MAG: hypothetical protein KatS3mg043_1081 [Rhodothermaceae bacterium]
MYTQSRVLRHAAGRFFALAVFASILTTSAFAQRTFDNRDAQWWSNLEAQLTTSLDSPVEQVRDTALRHVIFFATYYGDRVDFTVAAGKILDVYEHERHEGRRMMALSALHAIGSRPAMERLHELVRQEPRGRLHQLTLAVLADYFARQTS